MSNSGTLGAHVSGEDQVNVLLVDDQPARLMSYDAILGSLGHNLVHAHSGTEALHRLMELDPAAILLDINMPGMDGFETATLIHQHPRFEKTPIIFVTAVHVTDLDRLKGYELGAVDYVYVPVVPEILRGKVEVLVELYRQRRELERLNAQLSQANADLQAEKTRELEALNATLANANAELARANADLEEADRRKDDFLAMLSHELRNPLSAIQGAIELMRRKSLDDSELLMARDVLARQNRHLVRLVEDLLDVSRITRGKVNLQKERIDIRDVLRHALETAQALIEARRHTMIVTVPAEPLYVSGDLTRLAQVVGNLVSNAAKYTDDGGEIQVSADVLPEMGQARVRVADNGRGIPAETLPRVFEPSTHEERLSSGAHGGLGIGLLVVRGLVEMHGGTVEAESDGLARGSTFTVRLPLLTEEPMLEPVVSVKPVESPIGALPADRTAGLRILVVDDNEDSAQSMTALLRLQGHDVDLADAGAVALKFAADRCPDVILLDIGMPGMSGYEVARALRSQPAFDETLLVAVTGYGRPSDVQQTEAAGFDHHLVKPIDYDKLESLLAARARGESRKRAPELS